MSDMFYDLMDKARALGFNSASEAIDFAGRARSGIALYKEMHQSAEFEISQLRAEIERLTADIERALQAIEHGGADTAASILRASRHNRRLSIRASSCDCL